MAPLEHGGIDSTLRVQTPEGIAFVLHPAGFPIRACAWLIDSLLQGVLFVALIIVAGLLRWMLGVWFTYILFFALNWFYHTAFEIFWGGQSPGKRIMGIRVVRGDGSPVNPGASFLRNLLRFADTFMFLYLIGVLCMLTSRGYRRIGDWTADTLVVYADHSYGRFISPALRRPAMPWLADVPMVSPARKLSYEEKQAVLSFARRYPLLGKARADEIAGVWVAALRDEDGGPQAEAPASAAAWLLGIAHSVGGTRHRANVRERRFPSGTPSSL